MAHKLTRKLSDELFKLTRSNPFVDQAATHTFSDWLLAFAYDFGYDPDDEFPLGALPDLQDVFNLGQRNSNVDTKKLSKRKLLPLGRLLKDKVIDRYFIDLGCGDPKISFAPKFIAKSFSAKQYWGVDLAHIENSDEYFKLDLLEFLARLELSEPKVFFIGGVDPKDDLCTEYLRAVRTELVRLCLPGDLVILGAGSTGLELDEVKGKFKVIYNDFFHEISEAR